MSDINFNSAPYPGAEMLPFERYTIYNWILNVVKPTNILEIGTGLGGSTYFLSKALKKQNPKAKIYTCDPSRTPCSQFFNDCENVVFYSTTSDNLIKTIIENNIYVDFVFFDGPEDPSVAIGDIKILEAFLPTNSYFSMHDWELNQRGYDKAISTKSQLIRPYMEISEKWKQIECLSGVKKNSSYDDTPYDSVGLCLYQYKGDTNVNN